MLNRGNQQGGALQRRQQESLWRPLDDELFLTLDPWTARNDIFRRMDNIFSRMMGGSQLSGPSQGRGTEEPDVDIYETNGEYIIHAALPGVDPKDIKLNTTDNTITMEAHARSPFTEQNPSESQPKTDGTNSSTPSQVTQHKRSRYSSQTDFCFSYTLPEEIRADAVQANLKNGRLEVRVPIARPKASEARSIKINVEGGGQTQVGATPQNKQMTGAAPEHTPRDGSASQPAASGAKTPETAGRS